MLVCILNTDKSLEKCNTEKESKRGIVARLHLCRGPLKRKREGLYGTVPRTDKGVQAEKAKAY